MEIEIALYLSLGANRVDGLPEDAGGGGGRPRLHVCHY